MTSKAYITNVDGADIVNWQLVGLIQPSGMLCKLYVCNHLRRACPNYICQSVPH